MSVAWRSLGPAGLSSDSGLGGSSDGSTDVLLFGSVVDSVTEEGENTNASHPNVSLAHRIAVGLKGASA